MPKLHIANTFFEWELETEPKMSLSEAFIQHPIFRQLQFLSLLYAKSDDGVLLSDMPSADYWESLKNKGISVSRHFMLEENTFSHFREIESWGPSQLIAEWADRHSLNYLIPPWEIVKLVNSKKFSFENAPKLSGATLLTHEAQAKQWLPSFPGMKVLKTCYGVSGKGHLIIETETPSDRIFSFLTKEWNKGLPVIGEPWVKRVLDFSTQWYINKDKQITYIGSTICDNDARGQYRFNLVGDENTLFSTHLPFLTTHKQIVENVLRDIAELGFFGNVGVDAMLYTFGSDVIQLHPVVEINARKTMGWAALQFQRHYYPNEIVRFAYSSGCAGFLPESVVSKQGKQVLFPRNLMIECVYN